MEQDDGTIYDTEVEGLDVIEIKQERAVTPMSTRYSQREFRLVGPLEITIRMIAWGGAWANAKAKQTRQLTPEPKQLPFSPKQLPEHKDE